MELNGTNVTVSCVHPGGVKTNIVKNGIHYRDMDKSIEKFDTVTATTAEDAATIIINGMKKNKERILIGRDARLIDRIARFLPVKYTAFFLWLEKRILDKRNFKQNS
jgi:short-subunit dehydrogenase